MGGKREKGWKDVIEGKRVREIAREEERGTGREPQTETKTEGEKAPPLRSFQSC